jgi:hypothetical protein
MSTIWYNRKRERKRTKTKRKLKRYEKGRLVPLSKKGFKSSILDVENKIKSTTQYFKTQERM